MVTLGVTHVTSPASGVNRCTSRSDRHISCHPPDKFSQGLPTSSSAPHLTMRWDPPNARLVARMNGLPACRPTAVRPWVPFASPAPDPRSRTCRNGETSRTRCGPPRTSSSRTSRARAPPTIAQVPARPPKSYTSVNEEGQARTPESEVLTGAPRWGAGASRASQARAAGRVR